MDFIQSFLQDPVGVALLIAGTLSLVPFLLHYKARRKLESIENALPYVLREISDTLKSGHSLESALTLTLEARKDIVGKLLQGVVEDIKGGRSLAEALTEFAKKTGSRTVSRITSIIVLSLEAGASLITVLDRITDELWSAYALRFDRMEKTRFHSRFLLIGGSMLPSAVYGLIIGAFAAGPVPIATPGLVNAIKIFVIASTALFTMMSGVVSGRMRESMLIAPFFVLVGYLTFNLALSVKLV